jgi:hypothetical protein
MSGGRELRAMRLTELRSLALERRLDEQLVDAAMDGEPDPKSCLLSLLERAPRAAVLGALTGGSAEERGAAYGTLENAVAMGDGEATALMTASVKPLIQSVLCASADVVGVDEYQRAALLLYEMTKTDTVAVCAEIMRNDEHGVSLWMNMFTAPGTVFAAAVAKAPSDWTKEDAMIVSVNFAHHLPTWAFGITPILAAADVDEFAWFAGFFASSPYHSHPLFPGENPPPGDRYTPLCLLCLDLMRPPNIDELPEGVVVGAIGLVNFMTLEAPAGSLAGPAVWEAGFVEVMQSTMQR